MNLAWGGIVLLVLLLPGFFFFVGFYLPERFTRQLAERSTLGHLAGTILIALLVHAAMYLVNSWWCSSRCVRVDYLLELITLSQPTAEQIKRLVPSVADHVLATLAYLSGASLVGLLMGAVTGYAVVKGPLRRLAQHTWVYGLLITEPDGFSEVCRSLSRRWNWVGRIWFIKGVVTAGHREVTLAHVLTRTEHEGRVLLYKGYLKAFGIRSDGTFTYLVLLQPHRLYLELVSGAAITTAGDAVHQIAASYPGIGGKGPSFYLDGSEIANVFFDRERLPNIGTTSEFKTVVEAQQRKIAEHDEVAEQVGSAAAIGMETKNGE